MRVARAMRVWLILALAAITALIYWPSVAVYLAEWSNFSNITYTHGWLIVAVCLALIVREHRAIAAAPVRPWPAAQMALALCSFLWLVCYRANHQDLHITVFPALVWLALAAAFGPQLARLLAFPVAFFYFAVPSWSELSGPLRALTVLAVQALLHVTGPAAVISGDLIHIPNGAFRIEEGCSGLHFLIVGLAIAALHGELRRDSWRTRCAQLVFMTGLSLLANWIRVYTIIERGYVTNMQTYLVRVSHYWFGWGVFAMALVLFFWVTERFGPPPRSEPAPGTAAEPGRGELAAAAAAALILVALPLVSAALRAVNPPPALGSAVEAEPRAPWSPSPGLHSSWRPQFVGPDVENRFALADGSGDVVEVYGVAYRTQSQQAKLYGSNASILGASLELHAQERVDTTVGAFRESLATDSAGTRWVIWARYIVAGRHFTMPLASQLWYGLVATVSNPPARVLALRTACAADCDDARRVLQAFVTSGSVH